MRSIEKEESRKETSSWIAFFPFLSRAFSSLADRFFCERMNGRKKKEKTEKKTNVYLYVYLERKGSKDKCVCVSMCTWRERTSNTKQYWLIFNRIKINKYDI